MKKLVLLTLLAIVALSGCVGQNVFGGGNGVVFNKFSLSASQVEPGFPVYLDMEIQNKGQADATGVSVEIFGLTDEFSVVPDWRQPIGTLVKSDPDRNIPSPPVSIDWTIKGPGKTVLIPYDYTVRLSYRYQTTLEAQVRAVTIDWYRDKKEAGGVEFQKYTAGPLAVTIRSPTTIISANRVPVYVTIKNTGGGRPYLGSPTADNIDMVSISTDNLRCQKNTARLVNGETTLYCSLDAFGVDKYTNFPFTVTVNYNYYLDKTGSITILPRPVVGAIV